MSQTLNNKIVRVDNAISTLKTNLHLPADAPIEDVANLKNLVRLYVQSEEPDSKDGIWLQTAKPELEKVKITSENIVKRLQFTGWKDVVDTPAEHGYGMPGVVVGDDLYMFGGCVTGSYTEIRNTVFKFNIKTGSCEDIGPFPYYVHPSAYAVKDNDIYLINCLAGDSVRGFDLNGRSFKYNITTKEIVELAPMVDIAGTSLFGVGAQIGDKVYVLRGRASWSASSPSTQLYIYDLNNNTWAKGPDAPNGMTTYYGGMTAVGYMLYCFGMYGCWKFNTLTQEYTRIEEKIDIASVAVTSYENNVYLFPESSTLKNIIEYNTLTDTWKELTDTTVSANYQGVQNFYVMGNSFVRVHRTTGKTIQVNDFTELRDYEGEEDCLIIQQLDGYNLYAAKLLKNTSLLMNDMKLHFNDVIYYTVADGVDDTLPTYYGDGVQWTKFKN